MLIVVGLLALGGDTESARKTSMDPQSDNTNSAEPDEPTEIEQVLELDMVRLVAEADTGACKYPPQDSANWTLNISVPATAVLMLLGAAGLQSALLKGGLLTG